MTIDNRSCVEIIFVSKNFSRNIKGLFQILLSDEQFSRSIAWVTYSEEDYLLMKDRIPAYYYSTDSSHQHTWRMFENAKLLIFEDVIPSLPGFDWLTRNLLRVQLWHGVPYKDIGERLLLRHTEFESYKTYSNFLDSKDFFLVPHQEYLNMYKDLFPNANLFVAPEPKWHTLEYGVKSQEWRSGRRAELDDAMASGKSQRVILWAPTFREVAGVWSQNLPAKLNEVSAKYGVLLICKPHPHDRFLKDLNFENYSNLFFVPDQEDIYDYLQAASGLISDYSSLLIELSNLRYPVVRWVPDELTYIDRHGTLDTRNVIDQIPKFSDFQDSLNHCLEQTLLGIEPSGASEFWRSKIRELLK